MCKCNEIKPKGLNRKGQSMYFHQDLAIHNPDLFSELYRPDLYNKTIKKKCIYCESKIPGTWLYYWINGNSCKNCLIKFNENK